MCAWVYVRVRVYTGLAGRLCGCISEERLVMPGGPRREREEAEDGRKRVERVRTGERRASEREVGERGRKRERAVRPSELDI